MISTATLQVGRVKTKLLNGNQLLEEMWEESSRPSLRWLQEQQRRRTIPYIKIGHSVFFDPIKVRAALDRKFSIGDR